MSLTNRLFRTLLPLGLGLCASGALQAAGEVSSVETIESAATPFRYVVNGNTYTWGLGNNQLLQGFVSGGISYRYASSADRVELMRDDIVGVADGLPCGIFVERFGTSTRTLAADYPTDDTNTGNCDMGTLLSSRTVNRGAVDLFSNKVPDAKNIERVDYLFDRGVLAPLSADAGNQAGHLVAEKKGNNPVRIAAVLELDLLGQPAAYGPLVNVGAAGCIDPDLCYGLTDLRHDYAFYQNSLTAPQGFPVVTETSRETVGMAFVSSEQLGLAPGQRYFGFSLFADDVDSASHDLLDPSTFPDDTADDNIIVGDDADIYGGLTGYFVSAQISVATGRVFLDENGDGMPDVDEAGISDISVSVFVDANGDGMLDPGVDTLFATPTDSDVSGGFFLPGLPDGDYLVVLDETDADLPSGLQLVAGSNPRPVTVAGGSPDDIYFVFENPNSGNGGDDSGSATAGGTTSGNDTAGGDTSGGDTSGGDTSGGDTSGGDTSGGDTSGGDTSGGDTSGGDTSGGDTSGGDTSGADTSGGDTSGGDTSGGDTSGGDTSGGDTSGGDTSGGDTSGGDTSGGDTSGGDTSGGDTSGGDTSGGDTSGGDTSGGDTSGGDTSGGDTSGGDTSGGDTSGGDTSGGDTSGGDTSGGDTSGGDTSGGDTSGGDTSGGDTSGGTTGGGEPTPPRDDVNTTAINDDFTVNQGSSRKMLDVLANDNDGAGDGLTIQSVTDSANATIEIINNEVLYTPDPEFNGIDNFMYEIADSDNTIRSGSVTVTVLRFSDINNNGLNDFDECNCTSLTLETGVHGSGVGQVSTGFVVLLASLIAIRGRRRLRLRHRVINSGAGA